jgi:mRNA interferase RelE/StbE
MKVFLSAKADKQLNKLPRQMYKIIISRIEKLTDDPFPLNCRKLEVRAGWRLRVGDYRILYTVDQQKKELTSLSVAHRKEAYRY